MFKKISKTMALVFTIIFLVTSVAAVTVSAQQSFKYEQEAQVLYDLGLYKGINEETFDADLGSALDRETGVVILIRLFGLEDVADAITNADEILAEFSDADRISAWAKNAAAYAVENGIIAGNPEGTFAPEAPLNGKAYCSMILRQLGFTPGYNNAPAELAEMGALSAEEAARLTNSNLIKDDLVGISYGSLNIADSDGITVIEKLIEQNVVDESIAYEAGLVAREASQQPVVMPPDIVSAKPLSSKIIEMAFTDAVEDAALEPALFSVKDSGGHELAVAEVRHAQWDSTGKTVVATLAENTYSGRIYTAAVGAGTAVFGGRGADTIKPYIKKIASTDYNTIEIEFSEPVKTDGNFLIKEAYSSWSLSINSIVYESSNVLVLSTSEQKSSTLYKAVIENVSDFAGNVMDKDDTYTFTGTGRDTRSLEITDVKANDCDKLVVEFNVKLDENTIKDAVFTVEELYLNKSTISVISVEKASKYDSIDGTDISAAKSVLLTLGGNLTDSTLYKLKVTGSIMSAYGISLSSDSSKTEKNFVGMSRPVTELDYDDPAVTVTNCTTLTVRFNRKVDVNQAEDISDYSITEAYGTKDSLGITGAELLTGGTDVKLTVAPMKSVLYRINASNIVDVYGNSLKIYDTAASKTFVGMAAAAKISKIIGVERISDYVIRVEFDKNIGRNAEDISLYTIDNGIGCPQAAEKVPDTVANYKAKVDLTIPNTVSSNMYTLTVTGLLNADGVPMDSGDKVEIKFTGQGINSLKPELVSVSAIDAQTIKITFDRPVEDNSMKLFSKIWSGTDSQIQLGKNVFGISTNGDSAPEYYLDAKAVSVQKDPDDTASFIVTLGTPEFGYEKATSGNHTFKLVGDASKLNSENGANIKEFAGIQ